MDAHDEELTVVLLAVLQFESTLHTIAGVAAQAAAVHEMGVTNREGGDYSVRPMDPVFTVCEYCRPVIPPYSRHRLGSLRRNSRPCAIRWHLCSTGTRDQRACRE
jgi:hypothetical protein